MSKKVLACDSYDEGICAYTSRVRVTGISPNDSGLVLTLLVVPYPDLCLESMPSPTCVARSTEAKEEALYVDRGAGSSQKGKFEENGSGGHSVMFKRVFASLKSWQNSIRKSGLLSSIMHRNVPFLVG